MSRKKTVVPATYYLSPSGNDNHAGTKIKPFATLARAQNAVRSVNQAMTGDVGVVLRGGTYSIQTPITFGPADSGVNGHDVIYRSYPGEKVIISGGFRVSGWQADSGGLWKTTINAEYIRQVYVNGKRAIRARIKPPPGLEPLGLSGYRTRNNVVADWSCPEEIEFCYEYIWCHTRCKVKEIKRHGEYAEIVMQQPFFTLAHAKEGVQIKYPVTIENSLAFLKEAGQWYFDRQQKTLYYKPRPGERMEEVEVIVPGVETLLDLRGTLDHPVRHIRFEGLTFAHATWLQPSRTGLVDVQSNFAITPNRPLFARQDAWGPGCIATLHDEGVKSPANVVCHSAEFIRFDHCVFTHLGGAGIDLEYGARHNAITRCAFHDISGSAIQAGDVQRNDHHPEDPRQVVKNNVISRNRIHHVAVEYKGGVGVFAGYTDGTVIEHNEIFNLPYSGISVGWGWGETDAAGGAWAQPFSYDLPTPSGNNRVKANHIHHVLLELDDGGAIYTLGDMPGTVISENQIHDNVGMPGGIYLDAGSAHIEVAHNVIYQVKKPLFFNNAAQDKRATCAVHDNYEVRPEEHEKAAGIAAKSGSQPEWNEVISIASN